MKDFMLGQLYGLILKNCLITDYKISFTTSKPLEASKYLFLMRELLKLDDRDFVYYLEDVQYGKDESAVDKFRMFIPDLLSKNLYFFHRPDKSVPKLTIIYYDNSTPQLLVSFLRHLPLLQDNEEFSTGFVDACLSNSSFNPCTYKLSVGFSRITTFLINSLRVLGMFCEFGDKELLLVNVHDLNRIKGFSDICRGRLHGLLSTVKVTQ